MLRIAAVTALVLSVLAPRPASALENDDLLALVAMPLAVAAVSEIADVPVNQLMDVVTLLNDANVPPVQFVEVVRYVPVALAEEQEAPLFVSWLRSNYDQGLRDFALVNSIEERYRTYDLTDLDLDRPQPRIIEVVESPAFVPQIVRTRVAERASHPHGGPPGQLKKERGLQTGAEVVHGSRRSDDAAIRVIDRDDDRKPNRQAKADRNDRDDREPRVRVDRDDDRGKGNRGKGQVRTADPRNDDKARGAGRGNSGKGGNGGNGGNKGGQGNGKGKGKN